MPNLTEIGRISLNQSPLCILMRWFDTEVVGGGRFIDSHGGVMAWARSSPQIRTIATCNGEVTAIAPFREQQLLFANAAQQTIDQVNITDGGRCGAYAIHLTNGASETRVSDITWHDKYVAATCWDLRVRIWREGKSVPRMLTSPVKCNLEFITISMQEEMIVVGNSVGIFGCSLVSDVGLRPKVEFDAQGARSFASDLHGRVIVFASRTGKLGHIDTSEWEVNEVTGFGRRRIEVVSCSPDGKWAFVGCRDGGVDVVSVKEKARIAGIRNDITSVLAIAVCRLGNEVAYITDYPDRSLVLLHWNAD